MRDGLYKKALFGLGGEKDATWQERDKAVQHTKDNVYLIDDPRSWVRGEAIRWLDEPGISNKEAIRRAQELEEAANVVGSLDSRDLANMFIDRGRFSNGYRLALDYYGRTHSYIYDQNVPGEDVKAELRRRGVAIPESYYTEEEKDMLEQKAKKEQEEMEARERAKKSLMEKELSKMKYVPPAPKQEKTVVADKTPEAKPKDTVSTVQPVQANTPASTTVPAKKEEPAKKEPSKNDKKDKQQGFFSRNQNELAAAGTGAVAGLTTYGMLGFMPSLAKRRLLRAIIGLTVGTGAGAGAYMLLNKENK